MEMCSAGALALADARATTPSDREHVMPYLYRGESHIATANMPCPLDGSWMRYSVDTPEDLGRVGYIWCTLTDRLGHDFGWRDIRHLAERDDYVKKWMLGRAHNPAYVAQVVKEMGTNARNITWDAIRYGVVSTAS